MTDTRIGVVRLLFSAKATMTLLILAIATIALFRHLLDATNFSVVVSIAVGIFHISHTATNISAISSSAAVQKVISTIKDKI